MKNSLEVSNNIFEVAEDRISELEGRAKEIIQSKEQSFVGFFFFSLNKYQQRPRGLWDNIICIIRIPEEERSLGKKIMISG